MRNTMFDENAPASSRLASGLRLAASSTVGWLWETTKEAKDFVFQGKGGPQKVVDEVAGFTADVIYETATGERPKTQGQGIDAKFPTVSRIFDTNTTFADLMDRGSKGSPDPVTTGKQITESGNKPGDYRPDNFAKPNDKAAQIVAGTPAPSSVPAMQGAANSVLSGRSGRPSFVQMYNAVGLTRLGVITPQQLMNFANTGQFNAAAKRNLQVIQSGNVARIFDKDAGVLSPAFFVDPSKGADDSTDEDDFDLATKLLEDFFTDDKGKPQPGLVRRTVRKFDRARDVLSNAYNGGKPIKIDQNFANEFEEGMQLIRNYEDPRSIVNPKRWVDWRELQDRAGLIGYMAVKAGVTSPDDFNDYAFNFGLDFGEFADKHRLPEEFRADTIINMEQTHQKTGADREDIVEATMKEILSRINTG